MATPKFISESQFVGTINLDFGNAGFPNDHAAEFEKKFLIKLLGMDLYRALIDDLDVNNDPQTDKYVKLVDGISAGYTDESGYKQQLEGIKSMLKYLFFAEYVEASIYTHTTTGVIQAQVSNATISEIGTAKQKVHAQNLGVDYFNQLIAYIRYKNGVEGDDYYNLWHYEMIRKINLMDI